MRANEGIKMKIELPSNPDVPVDDRLALLEDPLLAQRLMRENPALYADSPPRTQREVLAWTTRHFGTALLAVTAAFSIAAGYFATELTRKPPAAAPAHRAVATAPIHRTHVATHPRAASRPATHVVQRAAFAPSARPASRHAAAPVVIVHRAAPIHAVSRETLLLRARLRAQEAELATLRALAARQAAAEHAAATAQARYAAQARARVATSSEPAPQSRPRSAPATATATSTASGSAPDPVRTTSTPPVDMPEPTNGGVKNPPTSPGGVWTERIPDGGTLGGALPPIIVGVPRDPCTPRGGRIGSVLQAVQIIQALSRH